MISEAERTTEKETAELRAWMETTFKGLRSDRSTLSYAGEFLKTTYANLLDSHKREARHESQQQSSERSERVGSK